MRLTIIPSDNMVYVDGEPLQVSGLPELYPTTHAVQWYGNGGEVEFIQVFGEPATPNQIITDISAYQSAIDLWNTEKAAKIAAQAAIDAAIQQQV